mmetsp:Transcript_11648/g.21640  ORF Transcript_11648/g.21640 Transcript_11648/m.21640 type:complete len:228 (-) Transcript_11648:17-700(-)
MAFVNAPMSSSSESQSPCFAVFRPWLSIGTCCSEGLAVFLPLPLRLEIFLAVASSASLLSSAAIDCDLCPDPGCETANILLAVCDLLAFPMPEADVARSFPLACLSFWANSALTLAPSGPANSSILETVSVLPAAAAVLALRSPLLLVFCLSVTLNFNAGGGGWAAAVSEPVLSSAAPSAPPKDPSMRPPRCCKPRLLRRAAVFTAVGDALCCVASSLTSITRLPLN